MKFDVEVTIHKNEKEVVFELEVDFFKSGSPRGNGYYMSISGKNNTNFEDRLIDIRYDSSFNENIPELYFMSWAYTYWSGENGSYDIKSLKM